MGKTQIEFDPNKNRKNKQKHGKDMVNAGRVLDRENKVSKVDNRRDYGEIRKVTVAPEPNNSLSSVVHTKRGEIERIISYRGASKKEKKWWEGIFG